MHLLRRKMLVPLSLALTVVTLAAFTSRGGTYPGRPNASQLGRDQRGSRAIELRRIHVHFDSVISELNAENVTRLSAMQQHNRRQLIGTLQGYNARGEFPHNYDFAQPTPYFIDRKTGTLCAVAFLLESTGLRTLVDRVARTNNNVWVAELKGDAAFQTWLDENGLTLDEAARIQVPYSSGPSGIGTAAFYTGVFVPLGTTVGLSTWNMLGNSNGHSRAGAVVGFVSGLATTGVGLGIRASQEGARGSRMAAVRGLMDGGELACWFALSVNLDSN